MRQVLLGTLVVAVLKLGDRTTQKRKVSRGNPPSPVLVRQNESWNYLPRSMTSEEKPRCASCSATDWASDRREKSPTHTRK